MLSSEVSVSFPRTKNVQSIYFFDKLPDDARVTDVKDKLKSIWSTLKENIDKEMYRYYSAFLHKKFPNFKFYMNGRRNPPLKFIRDLLKIMREYAPEENLGKIFDHCEIKFGHGGNAATAHLPTVLTPELAYFVGALRDGTLARFGKYEISISQNNQKWLKILKKIIYDVFKPSNKIAIRNKRVTLSNRPIFEYLHRVFEIPIGKKDQWGTPKIIRKAPFEIQRAYIRGFYDADGLSDYLGFCQVNKEAILFVKDTLEKLQIKTGKLQERKQKYKKIYLFNTSTKSHLMFLRLIGSLNPSKQKRFLILNKTS